MQARYNTLTTRWKKCYQHVSKLGLCFTCHKVRTKLNTIPTRVTEFKLWKGGERFKYVAPNLVSSWIYKQTDCDSIITTPPPLPHPQIPAGEYM